MTKPRLTFSDVAEVMLFPGLLIAFLIMGFVWLPKCGTP